MKHERLAGTAAHEYGRDFMLLHSQYLTSYALIINWLQKRTKGKLKNTSINPTVLLPADKSRACRSHRQSLVPVAPT